MTVLLSSSKWGIWFWGRGMKDWKTHWSFFWGGKDFIYLFGRERAGACRSTQAGGAADRGRGKSRLPAEQRAQCWTQFQDPEIMTRAKGRHLTN